MSRRRPWQVLLIEYRGAKARSRSFYDEVTAVEWAKGAVRDLGGDARAFAHSKDTPESPDERGEHSYMISIRDDELIVTTWQPESKNEANEHTRAALNSVYSGRPNPYASRTSSVPATELGLRALPDKKPSRPSSADDGPT